MVPGGNSPQGHEKLPLRQVIFNLDLFRLNLSIFVLHLVQMAMFVVLPHALINYGGLPATSHWKVYLPAVLVSFTVMVPAIIAAEKKDKMPVVFRSAVLLLMLVQCLLYFFSEHLVGLAVCLALFFVGFNSLEASLPSLISRTVHPAAKGAALGVYNTTQAIGLFLGGALGGAIAQHFGDNAVFLVCACLILVWLLVTLSMKFPQRRVAAAGQSNHSER